jgi:excisionase family DNA binding protein
MVANINKEYNSMTEIKIMLTIREAAELLGIGRTKTYQLIASGAFPVVRLGRCVRIPRARLIEVLDELANQGGDR